jgi:hypothetical protein
MGNKDSRAVAQVMEASSVAGEWTLVCTGVDKTKERIPLNLFEKWYCTARDSGQKPNQSDSRTY